MTKLAREVYIKAPIQKVFDLIYDPNNLPGIWPNIVEIKDVKESKLGGYDYNWVYVMSGVRFECKAQMVEFIINNRITLKSTKGIKCVITWQFQRDGDEETHLLFQMEYKIPASLLKLHTEEAIIEENQHEIDAMLQNIKSKVELELAYA